MSGVLSLRSDSDLEGEFSSFSDIKIHLENQLESVRSLIDLEQLIRSVNELAKDPNYGVEERGYLRKIRQRAYDRRRGLQETTLAHPSLSRAQSGDSSIGIRQNLDDYGFIRKAPSLFLTLVAVIIVSGLIWLQSVELYQAAGFNIPQLGAAGALLMVLGFSAYYAAVKSWLGFLLCLYINVYEVQFMISATFQDERNQAMKQIENKAEISLLREKVNREQEAYANAKFPYEDPNSKVYKNSWYRKNHLDRAWSVLEAAQKELLAKQESLFFAQNSENMSIVWLKVCYRLGLVFLCMVLIHYLQRLLKDVFRLK